MWTRLTALVVSVGACALLSASAAVLPESPPQFPTPLRYGPSWLPAGLVELRRAPHDRTWARAPFTGPPKSVGSWESLTMRTVTWWRDVEAPYPGLARDERVEIGGRPGVYTERTDTSKPSVRWLIDPRTVVEIRDYGLGLPRADLVRIAESVRPEPAWTWFPLATPLDVDKRIGLGTADYFPVVTGSSPTRWTARISWSPVAKGHPQRVEITAGPGITVPDGGQPLTVKGRPARFIHEVREASETAYLVVDLGGNRRLVIEAMTMFMYGNPPATREDLVGIAEECRLDPSPLPWIGARGLAP